MKIQKNELGFTLIELMIAVAVVGILSAIAIPSYRDYVRRGTLQEGFSTLSDMRVKLEQFYQNNRGYGTSGQAIPCAHDGTANRIDFAAAAGKFTFACVLTGASPNENQAYQLTATGNSGAALGHTFTLNSSNVKGTSVFKGNAVTKSCWLVKGNEC